LSNNLIRPRLAEVEGAAVPSPYGGKNRQVQVDLDPTALHEKNLTPEDVVNAIQAQNLLLPAGTEKIGKLEYEVMLNASTEHPGGTQRLADQTHRRHRGVPARCGPCA
jgi:multidrug efflux pump subunit AcrB